MIAQFTGKIRLLLGDTVRVLTGKDKGKEGKDHAVLRSEGKVVVEGLNIVIKHQKPRPPVPRRCGRRAAGWPHRAGYRRSMSSKVQLVDPADGKTATRIGIQNNENGERVRFAKKSGGVIYQWLTRQRGETKAQPTLKKKYQDEIVPSLQKEFGYKNIMQVPRIEKVVLNMGVGAAGQTGGDAKKLDGAVSDLATITGQKPAVTRAKKSIANFRLRQGARIGAKVTLRGARMYEFLDRLLNVALPRVRDFGGINPNSFDGRGNFAMGLKEQLTFPEIVYDKVDKVRGMDIIIVTTAPSPMPRHGRC